MESEEHRWSPYQKHFSPYTVATYSDSLPAPPVPTMSYATTWHCPAGYIPIPFYNQMNQTYDHVPQNVNPFISNSHDVGQVSESLDAEVTYYSEQIGFEHGMHLYDENRCSSTDTSISSSSVSTVRSHSSLDMEAEITYKPGSKRKRQTTQKTKNSKAKKEKSSNTSYKRWPKPPYSYCGMIITAIQNSPNKELTLQEIHASLMELFPFFRGSYMGWRDSVRHNLSHNQCFIKINRNPPNKACYWKVDWTKVTPAVFARQQNKNVVEMYKPTIQEHLGLPPIYGESEAYENVPTTPKDTRKEKDDIQTPQMCETQKFRMTLPSVEECQNLGISPYLEGRQDFTPNIANTSFELTPVEKLPKSPLAENKTPSSSETLGASSFSHVYDLIVSERRSSMDAAQHLHSLCTAMMQSPYSQTETHLPPLSRDSDALPMYLSVKPRYEQDANDLNDKVHGALNRSADFSIRNLLNPMPPCETNVTRFLTSETDQDSTAVHRESVSRSDRASSLDLGTVDDCEDILIIDI